VLVVAAAVALAVEPLVARRGPAVPAAALVALLRYRLALIRPDCLRYRPAVPPLRRSTQRPVPNTAKATPATRIAMRPTAG